MADPDKIAKIKEGVTEWNRSRIDHPDDYVDLKEADLSGMDLSRANFYGADLTGANLRGTTLYLTTLRHATLTGADLTGADLGCAHMVDTHVEQAVFTGCKVYGLSAWDLKGKPKDQTGLVVTSQYKPNATEWEEPENIITVDDLQTAQFIHLLLKNENVRNIINVVTSKVVLILGRFTAARKEVLDALRTKLSGLNYTPIIFDFEKPNSRDLTETISTLAHLSKFIIADITDAKSIPQELQAIVPDLPSVPVQPLLLSSEKEYAMFEHFRRYPWVLETYFYNNTAELILCLEEKVISPAESMSMTLK